MGSTLNDEIKRLSEENKRLSKNYKALMLVESQRHVRENELEAENARLREVGNKIISLYSQYVDEVVMQQEDTTTYTNLAIAFGEWQQALGGIDE